MFLIQYIKRYKLTYISVVAIFLIGCIIGVFISLKISENDKTEISNYLHNSVEQIKSGTLNKQGIFKESLISNLKFAGMVWLLGCTVIASFTIYILMIYKGFVFGYIIAIILSILDMRSGGILLIPTIILRNILFLPIVFLLATSGIRMYKGLNRKEINIKIELARHSIVMTISAVFAVVVSCIEAYSSTIILHFL